MALERAFIGAPHSKLLKKQDFNITLRVAVCSKGYAIEQFYFIKMSILRFVLSATYSLVAQSLKHMAL